MKNERAAEMKYENLFLDRERALYALHDARVENCVFSGPADGESALKECRNITVESCRFDLRYPLWHLEKGGVSNCAMTENCRAALWYDRDVLIENSVLKGIKALRECDNIVINGCDASSREFGWFCRGVQISKTKLVSEYPFMHSEGLKIAELDMTGKYSFQYVKNAVLKDCVLDTKDAFWHAENVRIENSVVKGEYAAWYSKNLTFVNCRIEGTQPFCYAQGLVLENCEMVGTDLAFENSDVNARISGCVQSVKNPKSGRIEADGFGEIILDENAGVARSCTIVDNGRCKRKSA